MLMFHKIFCKVQFKELTNKINTNRFLKYFSATNDAMALKKLGFVLFNCLVQHLNTVDNIESHWNTT